MQNHFSKVRVTFSERFESEMSKREKRILRQRIVFVEICVQVQTFVFRLLG